MNKKIEEIDLNFIIDDFHNILNSMKVGAERIRDIVQSLRTFSRLDEAGIKPIDLHSGIESTLLFIQHRLRGDGQHLEVKIIREYGELPLVKCYGSQVNQALMNILLNACDALEPYRAIDSE